MSQILSSSIIRWMNSIKFKPSGKIADSQGLSPIPSDTERPDSAVSSVSRRSGASPSLRPYRYVTGCSH